jgi:hypothetical protein
MLFIDQSGSMAGTPFDTLKTACLDLGEEIFDPNAFRTVDICFFNTQIDLKFTYNKQ